MSFTVRQARLVDMPQIRDIYNYYVRNTTISLRLNDATEGYVVSRFDATLDRDLPYLVAISPSASSEETAERVLGYSHVSPFAADKSGYRTAVELTLYLRPESVSSGIGTALMNELLSCLRAGPYTSFEGGQDDEVKERVRVKQVYAIMSQDVAGRGGWIARGEKTKEWYRNKFGFSEVGRLPGTGEKFGESVDVIYMLKEI